MRYFFTNLGKYGRKTRKQGATVVKMVEKEWELHLLVMWVGMMVLGNDVERCRMSWGGKVAQNHLVFRFGGVCEGDEQ